MASSASYTTVEESRWVVIGICLTKVVIPTLRKVVDAELKRWYQRLCKPPDEIDKQTSGKYKKTLPPSTFSLQYKNINGNNVHKSPSAYDYAVKDALSLAKLFVKPFMAKFTGFDDTMDLSALLTIMCEADPFITSGASVYAKYVRSKVRNEWAHCNFPNWTNAMFNDAIQDMEFLLRSIKLSPDLEKQACDDLQEWKNKVSDVFVDGRCLKLLDELRRSGETWQFEADKKINPVMEKLDNIQSTLLRKITEVERSVAENSEKLEHHSMELEHRSMELEHHSMELKRLAEKTDEIECRLAEKKGSYGLRSLPRDMVRRPSEMKDILKLLAEGNNRVGVLGNRIGDVVGIRGMGGLGKTILALAVAWEVSVARQVIWLDVGETPDCLSLINLLIKVLGGEASFTDIRAAQFWVTANTSDKDCLVILDDVWNVDHASVFDHLSGKCQLLITTRNSEVVRGLQGSALYTLNYLKRDDSYQLLYQTALVTEDERSKFSSNMRQIIEELLNHCGDLPLALSLVGSSLADSRDEQDWEDVLNDLKTADLAKLRSVYPTNAYPYDNVLAAINASFQHLDEEKREKFLDFALFPEDTDVPSDILELFWSSNLPGRTSCKDREARRILDELEKKSMIQGSGKHGKKSYRLHDLLLGFARATLGGKLSSVQSLFVEALRGHCENGDWGKFEGNKDYYFKYLTYHLHSSKQFDELHKLFFNFNWLYEKVNRFDLPSLISDFRFLEPPSKDIELLKSSLMLSSTLIERNLHSIGPQLLGRLLSYEEYPGVKRLLGQLRATCTETCHLIPEFSCLHLGAPETFRKTFDSGVCSLATSNTPSSIVVICGLSNGSITIFDLDTGREVQQLQGHSRHVSCLAVSQSGTILASGSLDGSTILWRMDSYEQLFVFQGESAVNALDFSADDQRVFIGTDDGLKVYCVSTGENLSTSISEGVKSLCTTKDGQFIATVGYDGNTIKLWKADTLNFEASLVGHTARVRRVVATDSGKNNPMLVSASNDGTIQIWDLKTYQEIRTLEVLQSDVSSVAVSDDKKYIISGHDDGSSRLWSFHTGNLLSFYKGHTNDISCVAIISNAKKAVTASLDGSIRVWHLGTAAYMEQNSSSDHSEDVTDITMARCDSVCVSASIDGTFKVSNLQAEKTSFSVRGDLKWGKHVAVSADDRYVVSLSKDYNSTKSSIKVWTLSDGSVINEIDSDGTPEIVRFSSDGLQVIIGCEDNHMFIWDWQNPYASLKKVILPASSTVEIACVGKMVYTCSQDVHTCEINLDSLQVSTVRQGSSVPPVISPDGKSALFVSIDNNVFFHWKLSTGSWVGHSAGHPDDSIVTAIDITSNGKFALSGSSSGTLSLVDIECSKIVLSFAKTESGVAIRFVCVLSDDVRFVIVDEANTIELRTFNDIEASMKLGQPDVKVTCITTLGSNSALLGCDDGELLWFHLNNNSQLKFPAHEDAISQLKGELGGHDRSRRFASGSISGSVKLWNVEENLPTLIWSHDNIHWDSISALEFVPFSDDIIIASGKKIDRINAKGVVHSYEYYFMGRIETMRVVHNSLSCVHKNEYSNRAEQIMTKWNLNETMEESSSICCPQKVLRVNNSGNLVAILDHDSLVIENFRTGRILYRFPIPNANDIIALALVPGAEFLLSCSERDKTLKLWNLPNGECVEEFHFDRDVLTVACGSNEMVCVGLEGGRVCFLRVNKLASQSGNFGEEKGKEDPKKRKVPGRIERSVSSVDSLDSVDINISQKEMDDLKTFSFLVAKEVPTRDVIQVESFDQVSVPTGESAILHPKTSSSSIRSPTVVEDTFLEDTFLTSEYSIKDDIREKLTGFPWLNGPYGVTGPNRYNRRLHIFVTVKEGYKKSKVLEDLKRVFGVDDARKYFEFQRESKVRPKFKYRLGATSGKNFVAVTEIREIDGQNPLQAKANSIYQNENKERKCWGTLTMFCYKNGVHLALTCFHTAINPEQNDFDEAFNCQGEISPTEEALNHDEQDFDEAISCENEMFPSEEATDPKKQDFDEPIDFQNEMSSTEEALNQDFEEAFYRQREMFPTEYSLAGFKEFSRKKQKFYYSPKSANVKETQEATNDMISLGEISECCFDNKSDIMSIKVKVPIGTEIACKMQEIDPPDWSKISNELRRRIKDRGDSIRVAKGGYPMEPEHTGKIIHHEYSYICNGKTLFQDALLVRGDSKSFLSGGDSGAPIYFFDQNGKMQPYAYGVSEVDGIQQEQLSSDEESDDYHSTDGSFALDDDADNIHQEQVSSDENADNGGTFQDDAGKYDMENEVISDEKTDDVGSTDGSVTFDDDAGDRAHAICFKLKTALENLELSQHGWFQHCNKPKHKTNSQRS